MQPSARNAVSRIPNQTLAPVDLSRSPHLEIASRLEMDRTSFEIDGNNFQNFTGLVAEFNRGFVSHVGGRWNGNLGAFNDYLSWTDAHATNRDHVRLRFTDELACKLQLDHELEFVGSIPENIYADLLRLAECY